MQTEETQNIKRQIENAYTDLKCSELYKKEKYFKYGMDMMYNQIIDIIKYVETTN